MSARELPAEVAELPGMGLNHLAEPTAGDR